MRHLNAFPLLALLLISTPLTAQDPVTPEAFFGYPVGADYHLTTYERAMEWFEHLAEHSAGRMRVLEMGVTGMGRRHQYAVISSADNMARLEEYRETARRLSLALGGAGGGSSGGESGLLGGEEARSLAGEGKAIAWIDVGLHSTEAAPTEHALQLAYDLVVGEDDRTHRIRDQVITLLVFPNPDGMTMVAEWYMEHLGTDFEGSGMPWLYNRYIGHDNNRDSYNVTQEEVRNVSRLQNQEWFPNVVYNHHQTAPFPTRIWIPPYGEPTNPNKPGEVIRWENLIGAAMGMAFDAEGKPGAVSRVSFDAWYPGFMTQVVTHHNIPSILTETALYRLATPGEYTLEDIPEVWRDFDKSAFYTTPWEGGWWRIGDAVDYCLTASKAVLDVTSRYREDMLLSKYRLAVANIERFQAEGPYGWAFPLDQNDPFALDELLDKFSLLGIEVHRAEQGFSAGGREFPRGTYVVPTSQPFGGFVKTLLERQIYPDLREKTHIWQGIPRRVDVESGPLRPYDVAGWTLSLQMGLDPVELDGPASELPMTRVVAGGLRVREEGPGGETWLLSRSDGLSWQAVNLMLGQGVGVEEEVGGDFRFVIRPGHDQMVREMFRLLDRHPQASVIMPGSPQALPATRPLAPFRIG
ncbi:M14 family metallopeptidase, partial [Gemmatimonadota bacterium]